MVVVYQKQKLAEGTYILKFKAPRIAKHIAPGQYVSIQKDAQSAPLALHTTLDKNDIVSVVITEDSQYASLLKLKKGDPIASLCGPLGKPFAINEYGNVILVADQERIGAAFFFGKAFKKAGNRVYFIGRYKNKKARFWESKLSQAFDKWTLLNTKEEINDSLLKDLNNLLRKKHIKLTVALCKLELMQKVSQLTQLRSSLYCSLIPLIQNGPALCSDCRVTLGDETKLPCIDGPLLNGHRVDWAGVSCKHLYSEPLVKVN